MIYGYGVKEVANEVTEAKFHLFPFFFYQAPPANHIAA
jgi:hypothetical protein